MKNTFWYLKSDYTVNFVNFEVSNKTQVFRMTMIQCIKNLLLTIYYSNGLYTTIVYTRVVGVQVQIIIFICIVYFFFFINYTCNPYKLFIGLRFM